MGIANFLRSLTGGSQTTASVRSGKTCPAGHPMDPSWDSCPRCDAERRLSQKTVSPAALETTDDAPAAHMSDTPTRSDIEPVPDSDAPPSLPQRSAAMQRNPTITPGMQDAPEDDAALRSNAMPGAATNRKLTGVLVTFSWRPQGQLFPLYEGRNVIGRGTIEAEGNRPVDVQITNDEMLSNDHATIRCRPGTSLFELVDNLSTNGTFYKGAEIERAAIKLEDGARFRTGATEWLMKKIEWTPEPVAPEPAKRAASKGAKGTGSTNGSR